LYKEQIGEIIWETFESYQKDEELYQFCIETYRCVMLPFKLDKTLTHSRFAFEFGSQRNEEQNEGKKMEVDLVVALEPWPNKLEVTSDTRIFFNTANGSSEAKGATPLQAIMLAEAIAHSNGIADLTLFNMTAKEE